MTIRCDEAPLGSWPDEKGYFGPYGGRFVPETLMHPLLDLENAYVEARQDSEFTHALERLLTNYVGRPTPLSYAQRLSAAAGGAQIWLKREDLAHTGAHKINNALGQGLLAQRMGKTRLIAETGAECGQGCAIEFAGQAVEGLSMEGRMTLCNMSIEAGARFGMVAPDETTFAWVKGRPYAPKDAAWD